MNLSPIQVISRIQQSIQLLAVKTNEYRDLLEKRAEAERDFDVAHASEVLRLKQQGEPATIIPMLAKGAQHVADLKFQSQVADAIVKASEKSMRHLESALIGYESILSWEKMRPGDGP